MVPTRTAEISTAPRFVRARHEPPQTEAYHPPASETDTSVALDASIACTITAASSEDYSRAEHVDLRKKKPLVPFYMGVPKRRKR